VTLAGLIAFQGVIIKALPQGVIVIQDNLINDVANYYFSDLGGWIIAAALTTTYAASRLSGILARRRAGIAVRFWWLEIGRVAVVGGIAVVVVAIANRDRGLPFAGLLVAVLYVVMTYIARRTTFGRHVYAVGGNAEAARRAGINVARVRILVFMIAGAMSGLGGVVLAARLNSVDLNQGGGTLLIDAIAAAVIGGTSLFGGRGEVRNALFGALVIATVANGLDTQGRSAGVIFIVTGAILLFAVTLDAVARRLQMRSGR
jgi:D-xylose transport system permease protein